MRAVARTLAAEVSPDEVCRIAVPLLHTPDPPHRMLGLFVLGFTAGAEPANLGTLRECVPLDPSWEVQ